MADFLVRNLDDGVMQNLKAAAKANRRSLQAEVHAALQGANIVSLAAARNLSARWHKRLAGRRHSDSTQLIRQDRDER